MLWKGDCVLRCLVNAMHSQAVLLTTDNARNRVDRCQWWAPSQRWIKKCVSTRICFRFLSIPHQAWWFNDLGGDSSGFIHFLRLSRG